MSRTVIYARVSTEHECQSSSVRNQIDRCLDYCRAMDHEVIAVMWDEGISAKTMDRPGWNEVVDMLRTGRVDQVMSTSLDRMTRNVLGFLLFVEKILAPTGRSFVALQENIDTGSAAGRMLLTVLLAFAQFMREQTSEKVTATRKRRAEAGYLMATCPFGTVKSEVKGVPVKHPEQWPALVRCFELAAKGVSDAEILRDELVAATGLNDTSLVRALGNRFYLGEIEYKGQWFPALHKCTIDPELWRKAQKQRLARAGRPTTAEDYLLDGLVVSSHFTDKHGNPARLYSRPLHNGKGGRFPSYELAQKGIQPADDQAARFPRYVLARKIDQLVMKWLLDEAGEGDLARLLAEQLEAARSSSVRTNAELTEARMKLSHLVGQQKRIQDKAGDYMLEGDEDRLTLAVKKLAQLRGQIERMQAHIDGMTDALGELKRCEQEPTAVMDHIATIRRAWEKGNRQAVSVLLHAIVGEVDVRFDGIEVALRPVVSSFGMRISGKERQTGIEPATLSLGS